MKEDQIREILEKIKQVRVAVYGDFCLDAYWMLDSRGSEVSVETGLRGQAVGKHYYSLGGASNVVANLAALQPAGIQVIGVVGDDIFGREMKRQFEGLGVDTGRLVVQKENFDTVVFGKRYLEDKEQPRIDFGFFNKRSQETEAELENGIKDALGQVDVLIFNQQVPGNLDSEMFVQNVNKLFDEFDDTIVLLDTRDYGKCFSNIYRKTNDIEAALLNGAEVSIGDIIQLSDIKEYAQKLYGRSHKPVFVTRGARGIITVDGQGLHEIPGIQFLKKIDTVGAGDTTVSALALGLGAGAEPSEAAEFANFAAAVTIQKLFQTGTANGEEILKVCEDTDYIYQPELAGDPRQGQYIKGSDIEICYEQGAVQLGRIKHVVFDHDGTISTLRQGWEAIMEPVMIKSILGEHYATADEALYHKVRNRVRDYIDQSTGIQTIIQMEALVEIVREFELVPEEEILDKFGYKEIYNNALMEMVNRRIHKFIEGELELSDYTVKGAIEFILGLYRRGVTLYLASGTDREDVIREVTLLGYAEYFNGGIHGAVGDVSKYSKKMVIEKILRDNHLHGSELAVFGDGPVEIREARKSDGIAVGIASDEIRRHGLNLEKRSRLIKAGAHIIIPDFAQADKILSLLFPS